MSSLGLLAGCSTLKEDYLPEYESGFFKFAVRTLNDGTKKAYLTGLTEPGKEQTELIYPEEIGGIPVYGLGYTRKVFMGSEQVGSFSSETLQKFYFPTVPKEKNPFIDLPCYTVEWLSGVNYATEGTIVSFGIYRNVFPTGNIKNNPLYHRLANVTYFYNYSYSPNDGYYWVDSYDESVIAFIPPKPQRNGYIFDGWYKESECINEWNFDTDITGKELVINETSNYTQYDGICLYAKWIEQ